MTKFRHSAEETTGGTRTDHDATTKLDQLPKFRWDFLGPESSRLASEVGQEVEDELGVGQPFFRIRRLRKVFVHGHEESCN